MSVVKASSVSAVFQNLKQAAALRVHCRLPKLIGIHFTETLISLYLGIAAVKSADRLEVLRL